MDIHYHYDNVFNYLYRVIHLPIVIPITIFCSLLGFGMAPPVSGRILNLTKLIPVTEKKLFETYIMKGIMYTIIVHVWYAF